MTIHYWNEIGNSGCMGNIHVGTSGWSYKDWKGIFYPEKMNSTEWLSYYAITFNCTEINSSFYHTPLQQTVVNWMEKVPENFLFCPKMSRYLTHIKRLKEPEEPLQRFFDVFSPMQKQMGPVLIQLPKSVKFDPDVTAHFYNLLHTEYKAYDFAMEVRHESWMTDESYRLMEKYNIAFVISHSGHHFPYAETITAKNIYFRFHGPGSLYNTKYTDADMKKYSVLFKKWMHAGHDLWVFFNNDWYGYGIENAYMLECYTAGSC